MRVSRAIVRASLVAVAFAAGAVAGLAAALLARPVVDGEDLHLAIGVVACLLATHILLRCTRRPPAPQIDAGHLQRSILRRVARLSLLTLAWLGLATLECCMISRAISPWNAARLGSGSSIGAAQPTWRPSGIRIATFNIAHGRGTASSNFAGGSRAVREGRLKDIAQLLRDAHLDLVVLNEVDFDSSWSGNVNQAQVIAERAGFPYWLEQRNLDLTVPFFRVRSGNAVLSKLPISDVRRVVYPGLSWPETLLAGKKAGVVCTLDLPSGQSARLLAVHLEHRNETVRIASAEVIQRERLTAGPPLIAAGDFNSTRLGFPHVRTDSSGRSAMSMLLAGGGFATLPEQPPGREGLTFSSTDPQAAIDWILVAEPWRLTSVDVLPTDLSDHRPVVGVVETAESAED